MGLAHKNQLSVNAARQTKMTFTFWFVSFLRISPDKYLHKYKCWVHCPLWRFWLLTRYDAVCFLLFAPSDVLISCWYVHMSRMLGDVVGQHWKTLFKHNNTSKCIEIISCISISVDNVCVLLSRTCACSGVAWLAVSAAAAVATAAAEALTAEVSALAAAVST